MSERLMHRSMERPGPVLFSIWCPAPGSGDVGVELALIQEPDLMAWDLVCTLLCAQSHVCEPVAEDCWKLC